MLSFLPSPVLGCLAFLIFSVNTVVLCAILYVFTAVKLVVPFRGWRRFWSRVLAGIGEAWISVNTAGLRLTQPTVYDVEGLDGLERGRSYLVISNHLSWVDIVVLQSIFNRRIPFLRFFLKQELIRVPVLGLAWWALDFPFMKRYSREYLESHPEKRGTDLETTKKACERFRDLPVSIINFVEGTRFTEAKRLKKGSPYRHLLPPRAGGVAFVTSSMGHALTAVLDVTIVYPDGHSTFWDTISGQLPRVVVRVRKRELPEEWISGDYLDDAAFRERIQAELHGIWQAKDEEIDRLMRAGGSD